MSNMTGLSENLTRVFDSWPTEILRPIVTNLSTAIVLFLAALLNAQFRSFVFPEPIVREYPLICRAEPYLTDAADFAVDFFIINRYSEDFTGEELVTFLAKQKSDSPNSPKPEVQLNYTRRVGSIASASEDKPFNAGKGELNVSYTDKGVIIRVERIVGRAVMKVVIIVKGIADKPINRMTGAAVPVDFEPYLDACYTRR